MPFRSIRWIVAVAFLALPCAGLAGDEHDHEHEKNPPAKGGRPAATKAEVQEEDTCGASPQRLAEFANGEKYDFNSVVTFITSPTCAVMHAPIARAAMAEGIKWRSSGPMRLDQHARNLTKGAPALVSNLDQALGKSIPGELVENPLPSSELLPLLGQLSLLSPTAARSTLTTLIRQEAEQGDAKLSAAKPNLKPALAAELAVSLLKMGVLDPTVSSDLADAVEEMALSVQADSLGKFFRGLAAAATADATLAPTYNLQASALNRGVQKSKPNLQAEDQGRLLQAVFEAVRSAVAGSGMLEPGAAELNDALKVLAEGKAIGMTSLRRLWKEATQALSQSPTQPALADAVAASLTPQMVFLRADVKKLLLAAAANYPSLSHAVQQQFVYAWAKAWQRMVDRKMDIGDFNRVKSVYFEPVAAQILEFPPDLIDARFLLALSRWGLVTEDQVEKKFPRLFLAQLEVREKELRRGMNEDSPENTVRSLASSLGVLTSLYQVYLPVLSRWVQKNE